jgi:hypothetical protein
VAAPPNTPERLFAGSDDGLAVYEAVRAAVESLGEFTERATRSQVAFRRRRGFAYVWRPGKYVRSDVPAVLSIALDHEVSSPRWKQVAHPAAATWMHHLELHRPEEVDDEVVGWLAEAARLAG